jgi:autotransporter-associated beta strand protein
MKICRRSRATLAVAVACGLYGINTSITRGQNVPISVTGFNENVVANGTNTPSNFDIPNGYGFYQSGYSGSSNYGYGMPTSNNQTFTSATGSNTSFQFQPYTGNDALMISKNESSLPSSATLTLSTPGYYSSLAFLDSDANTTSTITYTINYAGGATQTGTFSAYDWYNGGTTVALSGVGRIKTTTLAVDTGTALTNPNLYEVDVAPSVPLPVNSITFAMTTAGGTTSSTGIFAVSGAATSAASVITYTGNDPADAATWDNTSVLNFNNAAGVATAYSDGDIVVFGDQVTGSTNLAIPTTVSPLGINFANNASSYSLTGASVAGTGGLYVTGGGTVTLNNSNTYTGATVVGAGKLFLTSTGAVASSVISIGSGSGLYVSSTAALTGTPAITDNGTFNLSAGTSQTIAGLSGSGVLNIDGTSSLSLAGGTFNGSMNLLSGGSLTETGTGTLAPLAVNLYGTVNVNSGTFQLSQAGSNFSGGQILVGSSGKLTLVSGGTGQLVATDVNNILNDTTFSSGALLTMNYSSTATAFTIASNLSNIAFTKLGAGTVILSGTDSFSGTLTDSAGTLILSPSASLSGNLSIAASTTLNLNGAGGSISTFSGTAKGVLTNTSATLSALTVGGSGNSSFAANISGSVALVETGSGTITLSGTNTYTGSTNISSGTLTLTGASAASPSSSFIFGGGQVLYGSAATAKAIDLSTHSSTSANQGFNINTSSYAVNFSTGLTSSGGDLLKLGSGTLNMSGASVYTGYTNVSAGTLNVFALNGLPSATNVYISGTLGLSTYSESVAGVNLISGSITGTTAVLTDASTFNLASGSVSAGLASAAGTSQGLLKSGTGTVTLTGGDTYAGTVNISGGTLYFNGTSAFSPNTSSVLFSGGTLEYSAGYNADSSAIFSTAPNQSFSFNTNSQNVSFANGLNSFGGSLTKSGAGTLALNGSSTYSGPTTINAGTLKLGVANAINPASGLAMGGGTLDLGGNSAGFSSLNGSSGSITNSGSSLATLTITQPVGTSAYQGTINDGAGKVAVAFNGPGTQSLTSVSNYSGGTTVSGGGKVNAGNNSALGTGVVTLKGGTLNLGYAAGVGSTVPVINGISSSNFTANTTQSFDGISGSTINLTSNNANAGGSGLGEDTSAFYNTPLSFANGFVASYQYTVTSRLAAGQGYHWTADGMSFVLQNIGVNAMGENAGQLGWGGLGAPGNPGGPSAGLLTNIYAYLSTPGSSFLTDGTPTSPNAYTPIDSVMTGNMEYVSVPVTFNVTLTYNASAGSITQVVTDNDGGTGSTTTYPTGNLASVLGGKTAYIGFTGSDGYDFAAQSISNFTYSIYASGPTSLANNVVAAPSTSSVIQLSVASGFQAGAIGSLNIGAGALVQITALSTDGVATHGVLSTTGLSIAGSTDHWTGTLDITSNAMDVQNGSPTVLATITNQVKQGYSGGTWQGSGGITSSTAAADTAHLTAVGVILNDTNQAGGGTPLYGIPGGVTGGISATFDGANPGLDDVLVKFTYYGDCNLDGVVDGSDYALVDAAYLSENFSGGVMNGPAASGWYNGDFNSDGVVDGSDYTLMDNAFNQQGLSLGVNPAAQLATSTELVAGGSSVPEPTATGIAAVASLAMLRRRRRASSLRQAT